MKLAKLIVAIMLSTLGFQASHAQSASAADAERYMREAQQLRQNNEQLRAEIQKLNDRKGYIKRLHWTRGGVALGVIIATTSPMTGPPGFIIGAIIGSVSWLINVFTPDPNDWLVSKGTHPSEVLAKWNEFLNLPGEQMLSIAQASTIVTSLVLATNDALDKIESECHINGNQAPCPDGSAGTVTF